MSFCYAEYNLFASPPKLQDTELCNNYRRGHVAGKPMMGLYPYTCGKDPQDFLATGHGYGFSTGTGTGWVTGTQGFTCVVPYLRHWSPALSMFCCHFSDIKHILMK